MNFLREITDNMINRVELISLLDDVSLNITPPQGNFAASSIGEVAFDEVYFTVSSPSLTEEGKDSDSGFLWTKEFSFKFPTNSKRAEMVNRFRELKAIRLHYCNGNYTDLGRNDYHQNKTITASFATDKDFTTASWAVNSIFPFEFQTKT